MLFPNLRTRRFAIPTVKFVSPGAANNRDRATRKLRENICEDIGQQLALLDSGQRHVPFVVSKRSETFSHGLFSSANRNRRFMYSAIATIRNGLLH